VRIVEHKKNNNRKLSTSYQTCLQIKKNLGFQLHIYYTISIAINSPSNTNSCLTCERKIESGERKKDLNERKSTGGEEKWCK
jgi:hypothetical protein